MKFYTFKHSFGPEIGKDYPQVQETRLPHGKTVRDSNFIWNVRFCSLPDFTPFLGDMELTKGAKITDLISVSFVSNGYIVSDRLYSLFKESQIGESIDVSVTVYNNEESWEYRWVYFANNQSQNIDFENTEINVKDPFGEAKLVQINSHEELVDLRNRTSTLKKLEFNNLTMRVEPLVDCFYLKEFSSELIISERLGEKMIQ